MMNLRYTSKFIGAKNTRYRVEMWQETAGVDLTHREVVLSSEPVELEWTDSDKFEPVQSSSATLNLISMSDREFIDLYTVEVNQIRLDVYRNDALYWSGMLDPEIFEEPYSYKDRYVTTVTFSDFAILDRKTWEGKGIFSVRQVIERCLAAAGFRYQDLVQYVSTQKSAATPPLALDEVFIIGENFYDEEGEAMTIREALDETLRPFALRLVQKNGRVYLYDLNALYAQRAQRVVWSGVDASLEADAVYNNVKVTFSPYADGALVDGTLKHEDVLKDQPKGKSGEVINIDRGEGQPEGFRVVCGTGSETSGDIEVQNGAVLCRFDPEFSGSKQAGVMWGYRPEEEGAWRLNAPFVATPNFSMGWEIYPAIIKTTRKYIGTVPDPAEFKIKVSLDVLFDVRYNPFEQAALDNEKGNWGRLQNWCNYGHIPFDLVLCDEDGRALYYYANEHIMNSDAYADFIGQWRKVSQPTESYNYEGMAWLSYYSRDERPRNSGFGGWQTNNPIIGWYSGDLPSIFGLLGNGEYLSLPPVNGYLEMRVYPGLLPYDNDAGNRVPDIMPLARWMAYKDLKVEIVKSNGREVEKNDIEDTAWINKGAKETLDISTIFGTMPDSVPSARGMLFDAAGQVYTQFHRGGHTDRLERLLIGTVYSQYATRKHILSGSTELIPEFRVLTDASEPGRYLLTNEVQHLMQDESEIRMVQFDADNYEAIEYKS